MEFPVGVMMPERRQQFDRRMRPTRFLCIRPLRGRRRGFRRAGEAYRAYVDCPSQRTVALLLLVFGASVLDALCTLLFLQRGGAEANPVMSFFISHGATFFVGVKMALTGVGAWILAAHQHFPLAFKSLHVLAAAYLGLLFVHAAILLP
jgi:Domain of unknown function (DUF5658)